jgi:hypothetical protein
MVEHMPNRCRCPACLAPGASAEKDYHAQVNLFLSTLTESQRRLFVGLEAGRLGKDAEESLAVITGLSAAVIAQGKRDLEVAQKSAQIPAFDGEAYRAKKALAGLGLGDGGFKKYRPSVGF